MHVAEGSAPYGNSGAQSNGALSSGKFLGEHEVFSGPRVEELHVCFSWLHCESDDHHLHSYFIGHLLFSDVSSLPYLRSCPLSFEFLPSFHYLTQH